MKKTTLDTQLHGMTLQTDLMSLTWMAFKRPLQLSFNRLGRGLQTQQPCTEAWAWMRGYFSTCLRCHVQELLNNLGSWEPWQEFLGRRPHCYLCPGLHCRQLANGKVSRESRRQWGRLRRQPFELLFTTRGCWRRDWLRQMTRWEQRLLGGSGISYLCPQLRPVWEELSWTHWDSFKARTEFLVFLQMLSEVGQLLLWWRDPWITIRWQFGWIKLWTFCRCSCQKARYISTCRFYEIQVLRRPQLMPQSKPYGLCIPRQVSLISIQLLLRPGSQVFAGTCSWGKGSWSRHRHSPLTLFEPWKSMHWRQMSRVIQCLPISFFSAFMRAAALETRPRSGHWSFPGTMTFSWWKRRPQKQRIQTPWSVGACCYHSQPLDGAFTQTPGASSGRCSSMPWILKPSCQLFRRCLDSSWAGASRRQRPTCGSKKFWFVLALQLKMLANTVHTLAKPQFQRGLGSLVVFRWMKREC